MSDSKSKSKKGSEKREDMGAMQEHLQLETSRGLIGEEKSPATHNHSIGEESLQPGLNHKLVAALSTTSATNSASKALLQKQRYQSFYRRQKSTVKNKNPVSIAGQRHRNSIGPRNLQLNCPSSPIGGSRAGVSQSNISINENEK